MLLAYREMALRKRNAGLYAVIQDGSGALTIFSYNYILYLKLCKRPHTKIFSHLRDQFTYFWRFLTKMAKIQGSNGEQVQKLKVFGLFFYDTPFKNGIFSMVALIARRSKYDFWIPDEILTLETKIQIKKIFFRDRKF